MQNHFKNSPPNSGGDAEGRGGQKVYSLDDGITGTGFRWCISFLEKRGRELFGAKFRIYEADYEIILKLIVYFVGDKQNAEKFGIDLHKGILLTGPIGCGKTSLMTLCAWYHHQNAITS